MKRFLRTEVDDRVHRIARADLHTVLEVRLVDAFAEREESDGHRHG